MSDNYPPYQELTEQYPFFLQLTREQIQTVLDNSNLCQYKPKEIIFKQNTRTAHIKYVKSGLVKVYKERGVSTTVLLKFVPQHQFLGMAAFFGGDTYQYSASAIEPTEVLLIDSNVFKEILRENHNFTLKIINLISLEALYIFDKLLKHTHKQLPGRIADVLLYFSEEIYKSPSFIFPVTRKELADFAGTTKESFIRTLTEFKNDKIIDLEGSNVTIRSMNIVKKLSNIG